MEFGKVDVSLLNKIDLSLPADDPRTWIALRKASEASPTGSKKVSIRVGCPVWGVKSWVGKVYPPGTQAKDFLYHYSRQFSTIELNTTHYRIPDTETVRRWRESVPSDFRFCPKFPQEISHRSPLSNHLAQTQAFTNAIMELEDRLGVAFLQLPPSFDRGGLADLAKFLKQLPQGFPLAIEVRHPSFFQDHFLINPLYDLLLTQKTHTHVVITDVAGRRDVMHTSLTSGTVLIRFIGNELHSSDDVRVHDWANRLRTWIHLGLQDLHFFVHQPDNVTAPDLAARFINEVNKACGLQLPSWKPTPIAPPSEQLGLF